EGVRHVIERSVHALAQGEEPEQQDEADDRSRNQRQEEMGDEFTQTLKKQDLNEAGDHGRTILPRFYPEPLNHSLKIHGRIKIALQRRITNETHRKLACHPYHLLGGGRRWSAA